MTRILWRKLRITLRCGTMAAGAGAREKTADGMIS